MMGSADRPQLRLRKAFYDAETRTLAQCLLGCEIVHVAAEGTTAGLIVETEAYLHDDPASHAFRRQTPRNAAMFGPPGTLYIYQIYNHYHCLNVVSAARGVGEAVLIRALQPTEGLELMAERRNQAFKVGFARTRTKTVDISSPAGIRSLTNGPAKLAIAMGLSLHAHNASSLMSKSLFLRARGSDPCEVVTTTRIGIAQGKDLPYRYLVRDNAYISRGARAGEEGGG